MDNIISGSVRSLINLDSNLERFLLCSPFSTNDAYNYGGELTNEMFLEHLYVAGGDREKKMQSEILELIKYYRKQSIFLLGNKGCGKTTFIQKTMQLIDSEPNLRHICLDFGDSSATLSLKREKEKLIQSIYKMFRDAIKSNNIELLHSFIKTYLQHEDEFDVSWDFHNNLSSFYEAFNECLNDKDHDLLYQLKRVVRPQMANLELFQLFLLLVLFDLEKQRFSRQIRTAIIFDNLDNLIDIADISHFIENFCNFQNNIGALLKVILQDKKTSLNYTFIFVMRETTKANISPHALETMRISSKEYDITTLFPKKDIILNRINWYKEFLSKQKTMDSAEVNKLMQQINHIYQIVTDSYIHKTIFPFYNNDYRICVMKLIDICGQSPNLISQYVDLVSNGGEDAKFGGRGIIYRIILSDLQVKGYFSRLMIVDFKTREKKASLVRLLLTYLSNKTKSDCTDRTPSISLRELFKAYDSISPSEIIECLWAMFDLITTNDWNHLITFASSQSANKERLYAEKGFYRNNENSDKEYSKFRITCAGEVYLSNICTHYEFFSCRALGNGYLPLFCKENLILGENEKYVFEHIMESVYEQVYECCKELSTSYESSQGLCNEAKSPYNYRNEAIFQYHSERIIFSHVGYLDSFRCHLLRVNTNSADSNINIKKISLSILAMIRKYCELISYHKVARCAATKRFGEIIANLEEAERFPVDLNKTINRKR